MRKGIVITGLLATLLVGLAPAEAGRGFTYSKIMSAIRTNNADVIAAELERAEYFICGRCIEPVMALLDHEDYRVREVAAWWFSRRPAQKAEVRDLSVARLYANDSVLARNAADALGTFRHPEAIPALSFAAGRSDLSAEARAAAVRALGTIGHPDGEPAIVAAFGDADASVRLAAVEAYLELRGSRSGAPLTALLTDADVGVRRKAVAVAGRYHLAEARGTFEALLQSDEDSLVRRNAAWALGRLGDAASRPVLEAAVQNDPSSLVSSVARSAIRNLK